MIIQTHNKHVGHNKKFVAGGVDLVMVRIRNAQKEAGLVDDRINEILDNSPLFFKAGAPFKWVGLIQRYGIKNVLVPEYSRISKKYECLDIAIELDTHLLKWADDNAPDLFYDIFMIASLEALIHVCHKYKLPADALEAERAKFGLMPQTIEDCEAWLKQHPIA